MLYPVSILLSVALSFFTVLILGNKVKIFMERIGILGIDQQKPNKPRIATSAGLLVISGILLAGFSFIGLNTFLGANNLNLLSLLAAYNTILIITLAGFLDDINTRAVPKNDKGLKEYRVGLKQWQKVLLTAPAAIPLMAIRAGHTIMALPFIGSIDFGILYPLVLVPIAVVCVSNATNMLAGMNGLEAGLGFIANLTLGVYALTINQKEAALIALTTAFSLLAFLRWNWYPAKFLPGDSLTYLIGASFVSAVIIGNMEKFGMIIFLPWIIEALLKLRSGFKARSLGDLQKDGWLKAPYKKIYSLTHVVMMLGKFKEWKITVIILSIEAIISISTLLFYLTT
ncbi:MAG TPA: hypothetical protein ENG42_00755 [Candidatus Aenigmarchaeota archaeon]|nr:MAG: hypothetical protein DRP03_00835 [Candidatus Aenigmarchaeota archaeon]HDD45981.1 hypothetical protein [Candidatus Aenigmarchaeota archaeon]